MSAKATSKTGEISNITFGVNVNAGCDYRWESDEKPSGWNYKSDTPTYSSYSYAEGNDLEIYSLKFDSLGDFSIDNNYISYEEFIDYLSPYSLKQLLNPSAYISLMSPEFAKQLQGIDSFNSEI